MVASFRLRQVVLLGCVRLFLKVVCIMPYPKAVSSFCRSKCMVFLEEPEERENVLKGLREVVEAFSPGVEVNDIVPDVDKLMAYYYKLCNPKLKKYSRQGRVKGNAWRSFNKEKYRSTLESLKSELNGRNPSREEIMNKLKVDYGKLGEQERLHYSNLDLMDSKKKLGISNQAEGELEEDESILISNILNKVNYSCHIQPWLFILINDCYSSKYILL